MSETKWKGKIDDFLRRGRWAAARRLLEHEREMDPDNHWVITQLGVTLYEQGQYQEAVRVLQDSLEIVPDCPLTLWNLAGALDATGETAVAITIYTWLLGSKKSPEDDPCWESRRWTDALKTDCVYRMGVCFQRQGKKDAAEHCYHQYLTLRSIGIEGSYSLDDVSQQWRKLYSASKPAVVENEFRKAVSSTLQMSVPEGKKGRSATLPKSAVGTAIRRRLVASKK